MIGPPLLSLLEQEPGRAIMQYGTIRALLVGDKVLVQQPHKPSEQFTYSDADERLNPGTLDPELALDGLAYALLPGYLQAGIATLRCH